MSLAVVGAQSVVAPRIRADVDHHAICWIELAAPLHDLHETGAILLVTSPFQQGRRTRVVVHTILDPVPLEDLQAVIGQREGRDIAPLGTEEWRSPGHFLARLIDEELQSQRLPAVRVIETRVSRQERQERMVVVRRSIERRLVVALLVRPIVRAERDHRRGDSIPQSGRAVARLTHEVWIEAQGHHLGIERSEGLLGTGRAPESMLQEPVDGIADRFRAGGRDVVRPNLFLVQVRLRPIVECRPGVPHRDRCVKEVPRVNRRPGEILTNGIQQFVAPLSRHRLSRLGR